MESDGTRVDTGLDESGDFDLGLDEEQTQGPTE